MKMQDIAMSDVFNSLVMSVNAYVMFQKKIIYVDKNATYVKITAINIVIMKISIYVIEYILVKINVKNADIAGYPQKVEQSKSKKEIKFFTNKLHQNQQKKIVVIYFMVILVYILAVQKHIIADLDASNAIIIAMNLMDIMAYINAIMEK